MELYLRQKCNFDRIDNFYPAFIRAASYLHVTFSSYPFFFHMPYTFHYRLGSNLNYRLLFCIPEYPRFFYLL